MLIMTMHSTVFGSRLFEYTLTPTSFTSRSGRPVCCILCIWLPFCLSHDLTEMNQHVTTCTSHFIQYPYDAYPTGHLWMQYNNGHISFQNVSCCESLLKQTYDAGGVCLTETSWWQSKGNCGTFENNQKVRENVWFTEIENIAYVKKG